MTKVVSENPKLSKHECTSKCRFCSRPAGRSDEEIKVGTEIWQEYVSSLVDQIIERRKD